MEPFLALVLARREVYVHPSMKVNLFLPLLGAAVAVAFSSCSQHKGVAGGSEAETAEQIANGTMPPWIAENSGGYETGAYESAGSSSKPSSYAYNPPAKPSVKKVVSSAVKPSRSSKAVKSTKAVKTTKSSKAAKATKAAKAAVKKKPVVAKPYSVRKGDTLGVIAKKQGVSVKALKKANGLKSDMIHIGQSLKVPKK